MSKQQLFVRLRDILVYLYPEESDARRVVNDAGINVKHIPFGAKAINNWTEILLQAEKEGKADELQAITIKDYSENEKLSKAWHEYLVDVGDKEKDRPFILTPKRNINWSLAQLGLVMIIVIGIGTISWVLWPSSPTPAIPTTPPPTILPSPENFTPTPGVTESSVPSTSPSPTLTSTCVFPSFPGARCNPKDSAMYVKIDAGTFRMGTTQQEFEQLKIDRAALCKQEKAAKECENGQYIDQIADELEQHEVYVDDFWIMQTEVTIEQYAKCFLDKRCTPPTGSNTQWEKYINAQTEGNFPITFINWSQALTYAQWAAGSLPTEAQWEKACRGIAGNIYAWGNNDADPKLDNYRAPDSLSAAPLDEVMSYPKSANGLYEMSGNVREWTRSLNKKYPYNPENDRKDPLLAEQENHILRGGSRAHLILEARCANRRADQPDSATGVIGFRVVLTDCSNCVAIKE